MRMYWLDRLDIHPVKHRKIFYIVTAVYITAALILVFTRGLNLGIDFTGGSLLTRTFTHPVSVAAVRAALESPEAAQLNLGAVSVQSSTRDTLIIRTRPLDNREEAQVDQILASKVAPLVTEKSASDMVGPVIGRQMVVQAIWQVALASLFILIYIALRFDFKFGVAGIIALLHDVVFTLGVFALTQEQVNMPFVAAMLTIVGYSINDTVVVFDRIRENLRIRKSVRDLAEIADDSINQTLARSINTVMTVLITVLVLFIAAASLREFTLALLFGITSGAYSSIFIASPLWVDFEGGTRATGGKGAKPAKAKA